MAEAIIVCVDDQRMVIRSLKRELRSALGNMYIIETAESGKETLDLFTKLLADQYEIPVIIADYIMPGMKGDELLRRIHAIAPKTLKILLTGQANMEAVINAVNYANLYRYIAKPWETTDLILTVKEAIRRYFQEKQLAEQNLLLQNMNKILERQVQERTAELEAKKLELERANASKDKFFSILAHDLRAPFTGLLGFTEIFLESFEEFSQDEIKESLYALQKTAKTVYTLVENLLMWSRLQRGVMEYVPQEIFIDKIAEYNVHLFASNAEQKQITLRNLIPEPTFAYADHNMFETVFRNLISNAIKFTHAGGSVEVSTKPHQTYVEVAVSDTGTGINHEDISKLFRIDFKHTTLGTAGERGSGLGLILCKELVEKNGGNIWVESEIGKGTTFRFTVPKYPV
jgi:two-component system sensor histidine kinase/response regulator